MTGNLTRKPTTRRDAADAVRLKAAGEPAHINAHEAALLKQLMPEAAGPVVTKGLLAEAGRRGDDRVTKLIPAEAALLKARGGSGTVNPKTGLLEFGDGMGGSDNPGGGHNADNGPGSPGGGYGPGPSSSPGGGYSSNYSAGVGYGFSPSPGLSYSDISNFGGIGKPGSMSIDPSGNVSFGGRPGDLTNYGLAQEYAPLDTIKRLLQTAIWGPPKQYNVEPAGRRGVPTGRDPGLARRAVSTLAGPAGPVMSGLMTVGGWMRDSMSPETQEASMKESQARGTMNSTGQDRGLTIAQLESQAPGTQFAGTASGARTAQQPPPGYTVNPAGQIIPLPNSGGSALRDPIRNLLVDYVMSGRRGGGWGW